MPLARVKVWSSGEVLTASDLNTEINNILTNPGTLVSPMFVPLLHADGTIGAPGMSWSAEPSTGFARLSTTVMASIVNGANLMQWQPGHTFCFSQFNLPNSGALAFYNVAGNALWEVLHANAANTLHVGRIGWGSTTIYGGGVGNLVVHAGGVSMSGTITGISGGTVGLPSVSNWYQVRELRNGANTIYIGWDGGGLDLQVDGTYKGRLWPIDIEGASRRLWNANSGVGMTFHWAGQGGQPSWLWGGNDGSNMYVYNPSNFSVNYATTCGTASNSNQVCGVGGWSYSNAGNGPVYLWGTDGNGQYQYLCHRDSMSVAYANNAGNASTAGHSNTSNTANYAYTVATINTATGGNVAGRIQADRDASFGSLYPGDCWHAGQLLAQSTSSAYPCIGLHRSGTIAWDIFLSYSNSLWFGASNNNGMSSYNYHSFVIDGNAQVHAAGYNTNSFVRSNVQPLTGSLLNVLKLRGVRCYNEEQKRPVITVDLDEEAYPELVAEVFSEKGDVTGKDFNHMGLIGPIIEAIREVNDRLTALETKSYLDTKKES